MKINHHGNKYQITYRVPGYSKTFTEAFATEAEARFRAAEVELAKAQGTLKPPTKREKVSCPTLSEFLDKYVAEYGLSRWGDSYYSMTVHRIEHYIKPYLGDRLIRDIDTQDLTAYYSMLPEVPAVVLPGHKDTEKTVSLSVIEKIHGTLRSAFNQAIAWGYLTTNPAEKAIYPKLEKKKREVWTKETAMQAVSICTSPLLKLAILLAVACSMRIGEILGLCWADVHITEESIRDNSSTLQVRQELKRCSKSALQKLRERKREKVFFVFPETKPDCKTSLVLKQPKTESSRRTIYIPNTVAQELLKHKAEQEKQKERLQGLYQDFDLVFAQPNGRPIEERVMDRAFEAFIEENGLPKVVFHSLRHLSTSEKLKASGGDIKAVQGDTGHAQASMVTDVYSHIFDEDRKRMATLMEKSLFPQPKEKSSHEWDAALQQLQSAPPEVRQAILSLIGAMR